LFFILKMPSLRPNYKIAQGFWFLLISSWYTQIKTLDEKKKKFRSLIRFHSANKTNNYNRGGNKKKRKKEKNPKESIEQIKT